MKVHYLNSEITDEVARITFIGCDAKNKPRRPVIDLDAHDLATVITVAKAFVAKQEQLAAIHARRATTITTALQEKP